MHKIAERYTCLLIKKFRKLFFLHLEDERKISRIVEFSTLFGGLIGRDYARAGCN